MSDTLDMLAREQDGETETAASRKCANRGRLSVILLIATGLALYVPAIRWGLPATVSWSQDSISDTRTLGAVAGWPDHWRGRYPPLHYFVLHAAYSPVLQHWTQTGERTVDPVTGRSYLSEPQAEKVGLLILIGRVVSVLMALGTGLGVWATVRRLTGDDLVAVLAALTLMTGAAFTYFAHLANVDVPSLFWLTWSLYFCARLFESHRWYDAILSGVAGGLAISTKDAVAGVYPGIAVILLLGRIEHLRRSRSAPRALADALFQPHWLFGIAAFALPYLYINGAFANWDGFVARLRYWLTPAPGTWHAHQYRYGDPFHLLWATVRYTAGAVGWPMVLAFAASMGYTLWKHFRLALAMAVPAVSYYLLVIVQIDFVYSRFLFAPLVFFSVLVGVTFADLWRRPAWPMQARAAIPLLVFLPTVGYALAVDAEMLTDSRYRAEAWFLAKVKPPSSIGAFSLDDKPRLRPQYLPRVHERGYATYPIVMSRESFDRPQPAYLILTNFNYEDFDDARKACLKELVAGKLGYDPAAAFHHRFLGTGSSWLSLAGWGAPPPGKISPTIIIVERENP